LRRKLLEEPRRFPSRGERDMNVMSMIILQKYDHLAKGCPTADTEVPSSSNGESSTPDNQSCLIARGSKVTATLNTNTSIYEGDDDNDAFLH
jgi:hypothetical protein